MKRNCFKRLGGMILALLISVLAPFAALAQSKSQEVTLTLKFTVKGQARGTFTLSGDEIAYHHSVRPGRVGENKYPEDIAVDGKPWKDPQQPFKLDYTPDFEKTVLLECEPANRVQAFPYPDRVEVNFFDSSHAAKQFSIKLAVKNQISRPKPQPTGAAAASAATASAATTPAATASARKPAAGPVVITPEQKAVAAELNRQGFHLLQVLSEEKETANKFISPYSIDSAFGMLYAGAKGRTLKEIGSVLGMPTDPAVGNAFFHAMSDQYQAADGADVLVSNSVWVDKAASDLVRPDYFKTIETYYGGAFYVEDFQKGEGAAVADKINALVNENTKGMIRDIVEPSDVKGQHTVLLNTLYFEAKWKYPFKEDQTRPTPFYLFGGGTKRVQMMYQKRRFQYYSSEEDNVHAVVLPYENPRFELVVLMPVQPGTDQGQAAMKSILASIGDKLDSWLKNPSPYETRLWLPKVDLTDSMQLQDTLKDLGMVSAFDYTTAEFSGMFDYSKVANPAVKFFVSKVIHKTALKMDEYSTKAAAATAIIGAFGGSSQPPPENVFRADRPFIVLIRDNQTGLILFMGRVNDPGK